MCCCVQAVLQQVGGRTVLLDNRAAPAALEAQAATLLGAVDGLLSGSQLGSFSAPAWASPLLPPAGGALRADINLDAALTPAQGTALLTAACRSADRSLSYSTKLVVQSCMS